MPYPPTNFPIHVYEPEDKGFSQSLEDDLEIVDKAKSIIESFEEEIGCYDKGQEALFNASRVVRLDRAKFIVEDLNNSEVKKIIKAILLGWEEDERLVFADYKSPDIGSFAVAAVYQQMQNGEFDYE